MIVQIELPRYSKLICGRHCPFCRFEIADDNYHCVLNDNSPDEVFAINLAVEERKRYTLCPVEVVEQ